MLRLALSLVSIWFLSGCKSSSNSDSSGSTAVTPTMPGPPETANCTTPTTYASPVTITGTAQYVARQIYGNASSGGLGSASTSAGSNPAVANPIRFAEVRVLDAAGAVAQCAQTNSTGGFSFTLPQGSATYTINVNSRSFPATSITATTNLYASVLDKTDSNKFYTLSTTVSASTSTSVGTLTATANGDLLGGAFNIYDQLVSASVYLKAQVGTCTSTFALCSNYDPATYKISAYWVKGFNPNDYFGPGGGGLSFYLPTYSRLFILGGVNGNTDNSDTDHFDNSVIIHEFGHFVEDVWLKSDSQGGSHDGNGIIDPRLAWSEGWGNFIQGAVRNDNHYIDSIGNIDGTTSLAFYVDTETASSGSDNPTASGEGNFREFAVTRTLWDAVDAVNLGEITNGGSDNLTEKFNEIWAAMTKTQYGLKDPAFAFRNLGLMLLSQQHLQTYSTGSDWTNIRTVNRTAADTSRYGQYLISSLTGGSGVWGSGAGSSTNGACATTPVVNAGNAALSTNSYYFNITPATVAGDTGSLATSDLFQNNRFYHLPIDAAHAGSHTIQLVYQDDNGAGTTADLDLYIYKTTARFGVTDDMLKYSRATPTGATPATTLQSESATTSLTTGNYLINVNVYTGSGIGTKANFNLLIDGVVLCPGNLVLP